MQVDEVEWDEGNRYHATLRVSAAEIAQVIDDPASIWRVNRKGRTATHLMSGRTIGGAAVRVAVLRPSHHCAPDHRSEDRLITRGNQHYHRTTGGDRWRARATRR